MEGWPKDVQVFFSKALISTNCTFLTIVEEYYYSEIYFCHVVGSRWGRGALKELDTHKKGDPGKFTKRYTTHVTREKRPLFIFVDRRSQV